MLSSKAIEYKKLVSVSEYVQKPICTSPNRPIAEMNFIEFFNPNEPETSCLFEMLFSYKNRDGEYQLLQSFAYNFLSALGFDISKIKHPKILREYKHIDLLVKEDCKYAVIFENKLKGACFQRNQLARYIQTMRNQGYRDEDIFIVLLPQSPSFRTDWIGKSVWRFPTDGLDTTNSERKCKWGNSCWCDDPNVILNKREEKHCAKCDAEIFKRFEHQTVVITKELSQWMIDTEALVEPRERNVRSALLQFADYLNYFYNNRLDKIMKNEIDEFVESQLKPTIDQEGWKSLRTKLNELNELKESIERVRRNVSRNLIDKWYEALKDKWPDMEYVPNESFGYIIDKNIWVGCKFFYRDENNLDAGTDDQPFWGFRRIDYKVASKRQVSLVKSILAQCDLDGDWNDDSCIVWQNTLNGDKRCDEIFMATKQLGLI